jgi:hypothetical protein
MNDDTDDDDSLPPPIPIFIAAMVISIDEIGTGRIFEVQV